MLVINLPKEFCCESAQPEQTGCAAGSIWHSLTNSAHSSQFGGKSTLAASVYALNEGNVVTPSAWSQLKVFKNAPLCDQQSKCHLNLDS
jgi:hypothetical protein